MLINWLFALILNFIRCDHLPKKERNLVCGFPICARNFTCIFLYIYKVKSSENLSSGKQFRWQNRHKTIGRICNCARECPSSVCLQEWCHSLIKVYFILNCLGCELKGSSLNITFKCKFIRWKLVKEDGLKWRAQSKLLMINRGKVNYFGQRYTVPRDNINGINYAIFYGNLVRNRFWFRD